MTSKNEEWFQSYQPPEKDHWKGRSDGPGAERYHEVINLLDLRNPISYHPQKKHFAILGFCCDEGIARNLGRPGASAGPGAIRQALSKFPAPAHEIYDAGNIVCYDGDLERAQEALSFAVAKLIAHGILPLVLGGGHEIAWGHFQGIEIAFPGKELSIINFDAHFDMRPLLKGAKGTSGTSFLQIANSRQQQKLNFDYTCLGVQSGGNTAAFFEQAKTLKVATVTADNFHLGGIESIEEIIDEVITRSDNIYVSICLDVFAAAYAPGVSAPQPLGLTPWHVIPLCGNSPQKARLLAWT